MTGQNAPGNPVTSYFVRGNTILFSTIFYDYNGQVTQPAGATLNLAFNSQSAPNGTTEQITMTPPSSGQSAWTAEWDTRGVLAPQDVAYAVNTIPPIPVAVGEGTVRLAANAANPVTF